MNKMTDNEVIKALERMSEEDPEGFSADLLDFIKRLRAEKETFETLANEYKDRVELLEIEKSAMQHRIDKQQAEIEKKSKAVVKAAQEIVDLKIERESMRSAANSFKMHLKTYQDIESTISEFWDGLEKLSMFKGKEKPTLEELLEYIEQVKDEAVIEFAKTLNDTSEDCTGKGYPYVLCKDIDRIADDWTGGAFKKVKHSSLCETETYEGVKE